MGATFTKFGGVPAGGTTGQLLAKIDGTDFNTQWVAPPSGGAVISESGDFTLDASVHTDGCRILVEPAAGTGLRYVTLMTLATQPSPGYAITLFMTSGGGVLQVLSNDNSSGQVNSSPDLSQRAEIVYLGNNNWSVAILSLNSNLDCGIFTNVDA